MHSTYCVLVPLYNEESVIRTCLQALKRAQVPFRDVYLVDDGSKDQTTYRILTTTFPIDNLLILPKNGGKINALTSAVAFFKLSERYDWIATVDADTLVDSLYKLQLDTLTRKATEDIAAFCGHVKSNPHSLNPLVAYRSLEYFLTHYIYKSAQSRIGVVNVIPGCVSVIRSKIFDYLLSTSDRSMLTEDMDFTIRIHKENLGRILFVPSLVGYTQDPNNLKDYLKQIHRWYRGLWQVVRKHKTYLPTKPIDLEVSFLAGEGVFYGAWWLYKMTQTCIHVSFSMSNTFLVWDVALFLIYVFIASMLQGNTKCLIWFPVFYLIRMLNCFVFLYSMVEIFVLRVDKFVQFHWNKVTRFKESNKTLMALGR